MYFHLKNEYKIEESFISDKNPDLILAFKVIKDYSKELIEGLNAMESHHLQKTEDKRKENYYIIRDAYNHQEIDYHEYSPEWMKRATYFIFLNKTCYNGLYRLNSKGKFNVPFGRYKNPLICDEYNLEKVQRSLKNTVINQGDFNESIKYIQYGTFVYLDPPYRPLNNTSNFTSYSKEGFNDDSQRKLALFFKKMDTMGARIMLSNSDPQNQDEKDTFFDELYRDYLIERVPAKRNINRDASKRGLIKELVVRNYH